MPKNPGKISADISVDVAEKARDTAYWVRLSLNELVEEALSREIERREKENGEPFPPRKERLKAGRRLR